MKYCIVDFILEILENPYKRFKTDAVSFEYYGNRDVEYLLNIEQNDLIEELKIASAIFDHVTGTVHTSSIQRKLAEQIPNNNAFVLHSVLIDISGTGVAFSALSGTGKSTHLANWYAYINGEKDMPESLKKLRIQNEELRIKAKDGEEPPKLTIVNGDKPIVRFFDEDFCKEHNLEIPEGVEFGIPYAYGTPWCGKERLGCNMRTPLKHICFIERSETNFVTKPTKSEAVERIMKQVYMPKDPIALANTLKLIDRLMSSCELWVIHCNMEPESAEVAYNAIFGE